MPTYEYMCKKCGHREEKIKSISKRNSEEVCEECGCVLSRVPSLCSFHLKGSGWYVSDYKNKTSIKDKKNE